MTQKCVTVLQVLSLKASPPSLLFCSLSFFTEIYKTLKAKVFPSLAHTLFLSMDILGAAGCNKTWPRKEKGSRRH